MHKSTHGLLATLLLTLSGLARSDDLTALSLEELMSIEVIATPQFAGRSADLPASVTVLTANDFRAYGWRTLADALRSVRGFNITYDRTYSFAGVRGMSPPGDYKPRLLVLIDGMNTQEPIFDGAGFGGEFQLDVDLIDRIEIVRGPSASVFGGAALGGVVNVITRRGSGLNGAEIAASAGSGEAYSGRASVGGSSAGGFEYLLSANGYDAQGDELKFPEFAPLGRGITTSNDDERRRQLFTKFSYDQWRAIVIHSERIKTIPTGQYGTIFNDPRSQNDDTETLAEIGHEALLGASSTLSTRLYSGRYDYAGTFAYDYVLDHINQLSAHSKWWGAETRLQSHIWDDHTLIAGAELQRNYRQDQLDEDVGYGCVYVGSSAPCFVDQRNTSKWGLYGQDEIAFATHTRLTLGLRVDHTTDNDSRWSPRLGVVQHTDNAGTFKLLYATAFREPSVYEKYMNLSLTPGNSAGLHDEYLRSLEGIWEYAIDQRTQFTATAYEYRAYDVVAPAGNGLNLNLPVITGRGAEMELNRSWRSGAALRTSYTAQYPELNGQRPSNAPQHMLKLNLSLPIATGWSSGFETQVISRRRSEAATTLPGYGIANVNVRYAPPQLPWELSISLYNAFDHRYADPIASDIYMDPRVVRDSIEQDGRSWRVKLLCHF